MKTILDLGCGHGNQLKKYTNWFKIGIDNNPKNIEICQKKFPKNSLFILGNLEKINLNSLLKQKIDKIICFEVIEHLNNYQHLLKQINISSAQELIISFPNPKTEKKLLKIKPNYWSEIGHKHFIDSSQIKKILQKNGWKKIKIYKTNASLYLELKLLFLKNAPCIDNTFYKNILPLPLKIFFQFFRTDLFQTRLKYLPIWLITLPVAKIFNHFLGATIIIKAKH